MPNNNMSFFKIYIEICVVWYHVDTIMECKNLTSTNYALIWETDYNILGFSSRSTKPPKRWNLDTYITWSSQTNAIANRLNGAGSNYWLWCAHLLSLHHSKHTYHTAIVIWVMYSELNSHGPLNWHTVALLCINSMYIRWNTGSNYNHTRRVSRYDIKLCYFILLLT